MKVNHLQNVAQEGPMLKPKASVGTWIVMGISIFLAVLIFALSIYLLWPMQETVVVRSARSGRTIARSRFTQRSKMSRFANAY